MASGTGNIHPILTIAIPTWNRANILRQALGYLLPQIDPYKNDVEIIISDNASDDNTEDVVKQIQIQYPELLIIYNRNETNIQFYGNFMKCRDLAEGEYLWLLSDDDYVLNGVIPELLFELKKNWDCAVIYFKRNTKLSTFQRHKYSKDEIIKRETYKIGLISTVVFLNKKENDFFVSSKFKGNAFIGFVFFLESFKYRSDVIVLEGNSFKTSNSIPKGYNWFDVFVNDMQQVIDYFVEVKISRNTIDHYRTKYLLEFILPTYILFKAEKRLKFGIFETNPIEEVENWIHEKYSDILLYWILFIPLVKFPYFIFKWVLVIRRGIKKYTFKPKPTT